MVTEYRRIAEAVLARDEKKAEMRMHRQLQRIGDSRPSRRRRTPYRGRVITLPDRNFDVARLLDAMVAARVSEVCIVGDAFCRPIVDAFDAHPERWGLARLKVVSSSGMMWSSEVKQRLLAHAPQLVMIDFLNSSEASGMGRSITSNRSANEGARFQLGKSAFVIDDARRAVQPGSGEVGRVAVRGVVPVDYSRDPEKTAATFPIVDGVRCAIPGDYATVEADGTIRLLGRGSVSINTGGEKVFPEEMEKAIKTNPAVRDAVVVGMPDLRFGQVVAAAAEATAQYPDGASLGPIDPLLRRAAAQRQPHVSPLRRNGDGERGVRRRSGTHEARRARSACERPC